MPLERGTFLNNRYRIVEILGQGGMGSVYRAIDENLGVDMAVKENLFSTDEYSRQFRREATILAALRHPNLPRVTDHFEVPHRGQYIVMDYIEGEDLRQRMDREGKLPEEEVIVIGMAICDALKYLHTRNPQVVHRDVKPGNVKIAPDGKIYLVDFGLAKVVEGSQVTTTGARAMTPGYSPPEQYGTARTDERTDIYSLGATLYAALTGALPEDGLARAMDQAELTAVRKHNPKVSKRLAGVIEKSLSVQPDARYQEVDEFKEALSGALNSGGRRGTGELTVTPPPLAEDGDTPEDISAEADSPDSNALDESGLASIKTGLRPLSKPVYTPSASSPRRRKRHRSATTKWLLLFILVLAVFVSSYAIIPGFRDPVNRLLVPALPPSWAAVLITPTERMPHVTAPLDPTSTVTQTPEPTSTYTPTQTLEPTPTQTPEPTSTPTPTSTITPVFTTAVEPAFLGNSNGEVAYVTNVAGLPQIWIINVDGVRRRQITDMPGGACQPDWSPDGLKMVFISPCPDRRDMYTGSALYTINADGTNLTQLLGAAAGDYDPRWSPDGEKIAFTSLRQTGRPQVYILNVADGEIFPLATESLRNLHPGWSPDGSQLVYISTAEMGERLWVMDADGRNKRPISPAEGIYSKPDWSPDGQYILYTYRENLGVPSRLMITPLEEFRPEQVGEGLVPRRDGRMSPDGRWVVLESWPVGNNHDIWIMSTDGQNARLLLESPFYEWGPVWRPLVIAP
jgi:eukaryotic-like serine/threonine-protein kinase